jgi:hypothetical protein
MKHFFIAAAFIAATTAIFMPEVAFARTSVDIVIGTQPPPPRYEVVPVAREGFVWIPGYWNWDGRRHVWAEGYWERAHLGQVYVQPQWLHDRYGWHLSRGGWRRDEHYVRHDGHRDDGRRDDDRHHRD